MLSGNISIWKEEESETPRQQSQVQYRQGYKEFYAVVEQAKAAGFFVGKRVGLKDGKHIGTITYYNGAFPRGYDENGNVCELHVKFSKWEIDCTHTDLVLIK